MARKHGTGLFLTAELPGLAGWGTGYAAALAHAGEDYFSAHERRRGLAPRDLSEVGGVDELCWLV